MSDLISRQAAIRAVHDEFDGCLVWDESGEQTANEVEDILDRVPSAEPVITCDGCRFVGIYDTDFPCCSCVRREKDYYEPER